MHIGCTVLCELLENQETDSSMIRLAEVRDQPDIRDCAEQAYVQGLIVLYAQEGHVLLESVAVLPTNEKMTANLAIYPSFGYVRAANRLEEGFKRVYFEKRLS